MSKLDELMTAVKAGPSANPGPDDPEPVAAVLIAGSDDDGTEPCEAPCCPLPMCVEDRRVRRRLAKLPDDSDLTTVEPYP